MRNRRNGGFTLIEMLVVVLIIGMLMTLSVVAYQAMIERARKTNTSSWIMVLNQACENYKTDHRAYPPAAPYKGSANLHYYLGRPLLVVVQHGNNGIMDRKPALVNFTLDRLKGNPKSAEPNPPATLVDIWGRDIEFASPGTHRKKGVDIWSLGADDKDPEDDLTNWKDE